MTKQYRTQSGNLLPRHEWLQQRGFSHDPFSAAAFLAETDPLLEECFVYPPNYANIRGHSQNPGYKFIFAVSGGGKSSLRKRIKLEFDENLKNRFIPDEPRVLAIEYIDHDYPSDKVDAHSHVLRIVNLINIALKTHNLDMDLKIDNQLPSRPLLTQVVRECLHSGLVDGICILIDNVNIPDDVGIEDAYRHIRALTARYDLLSLQGIIFKFILPQELLKSFQNDLPLKIFPPFTLNWDEGLLEDALYLRLNACSKEKTGNHLAELFGNNKDIETRFVQIGYQANNPRVMWQLGFQSLEEHFQKSSYLRWVEELPSDNIIKEVSDELINQAADEEPDSRKIEYLENKKLRKLRRKISDRFSEDEIRTLCFDLDIDYDNLGGSTKNGKTRELINHIKRNGRLPDLMTLIKQERPTSSW